MSIDTNMYGEGISQEVREALGKCQDYIANPGGCRIYGSCRWMNVNSEGLAIKWIENCISLQEAKRRGESPLEKAKD
jgi:hypothetical protein